MEQALPDRRMELIMPGIFFSEELREKVLDLFKVDARDRAKLKQILR